MISRRYFNKTVANLARSGIAVNLMSRTAFAGDMNGNRDHRLPDEAGPHLRTFMQWPVNRTVYPDPVFLKTVQRAIASIANAISEFEPVVMLMDRKYQKSAKKLLSGRIKFWNIPTDDLWCRDSGPLFVKNSTGELAISHLKFNGWGGKQVYTNDGQIAPLISKRMKIPLIESGLNGEAGGVEFDGVATLMAHESSWVIDNRNLGTREEIEELLIRAVGGKKLIWAPGLKGADITDYHIDSLARFPQPGTILIQLPEKNNPRDKWASAAYNTYDILKSATDAAGRKFKITVIPEPAFTRVSSASFVASYVNYYVCNGAVMVAQFGDRDTDMQARAALAQLFPGREIAGLDIDPIGEIGGGIHCTTQQQPKV